MLRGEWTMRNTLDNTIKERINNNIKYLIEKNNISQSTLSKETEKSVTHINAILNGHGTMTLGTLISICEYFKISIDDVIYKDLGENQK